MHTIHILIVATMTRPVSLSEEAYRTLSRLKGKNMSFSDVVIKLTGSAAPKRNFLRFAGALEAQAPELERFKKQIEKERKANVERV